MKHKHSEMIHAFADGAQIQRRNQDFGSCDCGPEWTDVKRPTWYDYDVYRVKPKEYPKTTLSHGQQMEVVRLTPGNYCESYEALCNAAIQEFITSGEMDKYIEENK